MKFINDESVIGKWHNIGWIDGFTHNLESLHERDLEFDEVYFLPEGEGYWIFEGWTKGVLRIHYGGQEPVLFYTYSIQLLRRKEYLYLELQDRIELFINVDHIRYSKESIGRHDNIDLPFVMDEIILGKWQSCGFINAIEEYSGKKQDDLCLSSIEFFPDGKLIQHYMDRIWEDQWTKGYVLSLQHCTAAKYEIQMIDEKEYLFIQWKMGNYIYGGIENEYYVFERA